MRTAIESFIIVLSLLCSLASGEVSAVINGPTEAKVGDLIVLSGRDSIGDNMRWVQPQRIQTLLCGDGADLAFATGTPGTYKFLLIVADKSADIDYVEHTVKVTGSTIPTPDPNPDEPAPDPDPDEPTPVPPSLDELRQISKDAAARLNDKVTADGLAKVITDTIAALEARCDAGQCPGLDEAKRVVLAAIESRLLLREGASRGVDWLNGWRVPINAKLKEINAADVPTYLTAMRAVALGLSQ